MVSVIVDNEQCYAMICQVVCLVCMFNISLDTDRMVVGMVNFGGKLDCG